MIIVPIMFNTLVYDRQTSLTIINSPHWQGALKGCDKDSATPLKLLIKHLPGLLAVNLQIIILFFCKTRFLQMQLKLCYFGVLIEYRMIKEKSLLLKHILNFWMIFKIP